MCHMECRPIIISKPMKRVKAVLIGGFDNTFVIARVVREQFAHHISVQIVQHALNSLGLVAYVKKKLCLSKKNFTTCLSFARSYLHWTIKD